jgi:hypothetical protein
MLPAVLIAAELAAAPAGISDPASFVTGVYQHYVKAQSAHADYTPPESIFTARLSKLIRDDRKRAKGELGCLDFDFWVNGQDWTLTNASEFDTNRVFGVRTEYSLSHICVGPANSIPSPASRAPDPRNVKAQSKRRSSNGPSQAPSKKQSRRVSSQGPCRIRTASSCLVNCAAHASRGRPGTSS